MAKASYSSKHNLQRLFIIFGVLISIAALGIIVYSSQKTTSTQSSAWGVCGKNPILSEIKGGGYPKGYAKSVEYKMRIKNVDDNTGSGDCKDDRYRISFNLPSDKWSANALNYPDNVITLSEGDSKTFIVKVKRPDGATNGRKNITVRAVNEKARPNGTRPSDKEIIGYTVENGNTGKTDKRTNAPVETEDDNDAKDCTRDPGIWTGSIDSNTNNTNIAYNIKLGIKNNCTTNQRFKVALTLNTTYALTGAFQWKIDDEDWMSPYFTSLPANGTKQLNIFMFIPKNASNVKVSPSITGRFPNQDLFNKTSVVIQRENTRYQ